MLFNKVDNSQKINLIFAAVGMMDITRKWYRRNVDNYFEIYIKADLIKIIRLNKKKIYHSKKKQYITKCYSSVFEKTIIKAINNIKIQIRKKLPNKTKILAKSEIMELLESDSN